MNKKITLCSLLAVTLLSTASYAAVGGKSSNGEPFANLEELIAANTAEIESNARIIAENADAIAANTDAIVVLQTSADAADLSLTSLENHIAQNELDIVAANLAIQNNTDSITDLTITISRAINQIQSDIVTLKGSVASLTSGLAALRTDMNDEIALLRTAITNNSADIGTLSAIVTLMGQDIGTIQGEILELFGRIATAETALADHTTKLAQIDSGMALMNLRVTALEELHERTIVFNGTAADDYAPGVMSTMLASLKLTNEDWVYMRATNNSGTSELCTSNNDAVTVINGMLNDENHSFRVHYDDETLLRAAGSNTWESARIGYFVSSSEYDGSVLLEAFDISGNSSNAGIVENHPDGEIWANLSFDNEFDNTVTIKAGATRLEACGF